MLAHGVTAKLLVGLIKAGLATVHAQRMVAGWMAPSPAFAGC